MLSHKNLKIFTPNVILNDDDDDGSDVELFYVKSSLTMCVKPYYQPASIIGGPHHYKPLAFH